MALTALVCPNCNAPLPPSAESTVVCQYCGHVITDVPTVPWGSQLLREPWRGAPEDEGKPRVFVGDLLFVVLGRIARGARADVYLAKRDRRLTEMVVLKVLRESNDADERALVNEWEALSALDSSRVPSMDYFRQLIPQRVRHGKLHEGTAQGPLTSVFRWRSGFIHSVHGALGVLSSGIEPRAVVWIWRRTLEQLGWVHRVRYVHGAILPEHVLLHERDHGVTLVGWSNARPLGTRSVAVPMDGGVRAFYPDQVLAGQAMDEQTDIKMTARVMAAALGAKPGTLAMPSSVPGPLRALLEQVDRTGWPEGATALVSHVGRVARECFGPPAYIPFEISKSNAATGGVPSR